jgi:hypothetical protein
LYVVLTKLSYCWHLKFNILIKLIFVYCKSGIFVRPKFRKILDKLVRLNSQKILPPVLLNFYVTKQISYPLLSWKSSTSFCENGQNLIPCENFWFHSTNISMSKQDLSITQIKQVTTNNKAISYNIMMKFMWKFQGYWILNESLLQRNVVPMWYLTTLANMYMKHARHNVQQKTFS